MPKAGERCINCGQTIREVQVRIRGRYEGALPAPTPKLVCGCPPGLVGPRSASDPVEG